MDGYIQIYNGSLEDNNIIFEEHNLIVDSAAEHICRMFTYPPSPLSISSLVTLPNSVAGITAISLGSAQGSKSYNSMGFSGIQALEGIAPLPTDTTIQPPLYDSETSGPGRMGQFLNYIDFSGHYPTLSPSEIKNHGCYIPSGGIFAASGYETTYEWLEIDTFEERGIAIKSDGTLHGWGRFDQFPGEFILNNIPTENNFSSVSLGTDHAIALTRQGEIISWGSDSNGEVSNTPSGTGFVKVSAGRGRSMAIDSSGYIQQWGEPSFSGGLDVYPPTASGFTEISAAAAHSMALDNSGYITVWGTLTGDMKDNTPDTSGWTAISAGNRHSLALSGANATGNYQVSAWGDSPSIAGTPSGSGESFTAIAAGYRHNLALSSNGAISAWGVDGVHDNVSGAPTVLGFSGIAAGHDLNLTLSGDYLVSGWGDDTYRGISDIPASGIVATKYLYSGTLNNTSSINSEGYILESRVARDSQIITDASSGFLVSGIGTVSSTREVKYILTLNHDEWYYLDKYYGGIGSIGLWTLDIEETLKKHPEGTTMNNIDLYNLADTSKNPVFKLFSKKVFLPGGLQFHQNDHRDSFLTIVWSIKF
tara:strand:- start:1189 stop:2961 length:1773 start_codon:yes stop_codon:yes gene_type:complete